MYRHVGETFKIGKTVLKVVPQIGSFDEDTQCKGCYFDHDNLCSKYDSAENREAGDCSDDQRGDSCNVIFVEVLEPHTLVAEAITAPMFSKRETLALEYCKACLPNAPKTRGPNVVVAIAFAFADEFIEQSEESK